MVLHPECQVQAQKEIDTVIGTDRLPEFEDREKLPYLECLLQEVVRWNHAAPTGLPHRNLEDDVYRDMFIPKNATIIANIRAMTLDESVYKDATKFDPMRFLPAPEGRNEPYRPVVFGFGRRRCPGRFLADDNLWIAIATVLATVSILPDTDKDGKEIMPEASVMLAGVTTCAKPFTCRIVSRSRQASKVLAQHTDNV
ncbi:O-methylsterigmatocystin oxidoreductase [Termitomyces sp. T112]|nr:O-methylsterigmatocystin oxidoreductase [Termitomyces sp. T112]